MSKNRDREIFLFCSPCCGKLKWWDWNPAKPGGGTVLCPCELLKAASLSSWKDSDNPHFPGLLLPPSLYWQAMLHKWKMKQMRRLPLRLPSLMSSVQLLHRLQRQKWLMSDWAPFPCSPERCFETGSQVPAPLRVCPQPEKRAGGCYIDYTCNRGLEGRKLSTSLSERFFFPQNPKSWR